MKLAINLSPMMKGKTYAEMFELFSSVGFKSVDFMLNDLIKDDSPMSGENYVEYALTVKETAEKYGMEIIQTHAPFQFKNWDDGEHFNNVILPRTIRSLEISALMGAKVCVVHGLHYLTYSENVETLFDMNMNFYRTLIPYAEKFGIKIGVENLWQRDKRRKCIVRSICGYTDEFMRYLDTLNSPYITACVDVGHAALVVGGDEPQTMLRKLGHDRVGTLHVHDVDYQNDLHTLPYFGKMNWAEITSALADISYEGALVFEVNDSLFTCSDTSFHSLAARIIHDVGQHITAQIELKKMGGTQ